VVAGGYLTCSVHVLWMSYVMFQRKDAGLLLVPRRQGKKMSNKKQGVVTQNED